MPGSDSEGVETVTITLAGLELTISARPAPSNSSGEAARIVVESASASESTPERSTDLVVYHDPFSLPEELKDQAVRAATIADLAAIPLPFLAYLTPQLRTARSGLQGLDLLVHLERVSSEGRGSRVSTWTRCR